MVVSRTEIISIGYWILFSVIKRLINLLSQCAREMADAAAARKQAEGAHRHVEGLITQDSKVRFD